MCSSSSKQSPQQQQVYIPPPEPIPLPPPPAPPPKLPETPRTPNVDESQKGKDADKRRRRAASGNKSRGGTILTGPRGADQSSAVATKTLLGQ